MTYTVKQLAEVSGVSVRTLHFYDEIGLLQPAYLGANGYRFYEEPQLLKLQQILFYRELGLELRQIQRVLGQADFEVLAALESHRTVLKKKLARTRKLIVTIDKTIAHLKGKSKMSNQEMFAGFNPEAQAKHEQYLIDRYGPEMKEGIAQSKAKVKHWTKTQWQESGEAFQQICRDLVAAMERGLTAESAETQAIIQRHYHWLARFWTPTRESYAGHSELIVDSELRNAYAVHHPHLPEYAAAGMKIFAERELTY